MLLLYLIVRVTLSLSCLLARISCPSGINLQNVYRLINYHRSLLCSLLALCICPEYIASRMCWAYQSQYIYIYLHIILHSPNNPYLASKFHASLNNLYLLQKILLRFEYKLMQRQAYNNEI